MTHRSQYRFRPSLLDEGPEELRLEAVKPDIEKIILRFDRFPVGGSLLRKHPVYGGDNQHDNNYPFLQDVALEMVATQILPKWQPCDEHSFKQWWSRFGYPMLRAAIGEELERTDVNLRGLWDARARRFRVQEAVPFSVSADSTTDCAARLHEFAGPELSPADHRYRIVRKVASFADEVTDRQWREVLTDDEAGVITSFLECYGDVSLTALNWGLSDSWTRRKVSRICEKAMKVIRASIDDRLGIEEVPVTWADIQIEAAGLYADEWRSYGRGKRRTKSSERVTERMPADRITWGHKQLKIKEARDDVRFSQEKG